MRRANGLSRAIAALRKRRRLAVMIAVAAAIVLCILVWRVLPSRFPAAVPEASVQPAAARPAEPAPRPTTIVGFADGCITAECHSVMSASTFVHAPVAQSACDACHQPDVGGHKFPLTVGHNELCGTCHLTGRHEAIQHQAVRDGGCLACHDPHTSQTRSLLSAGNVTKTCIRCHPGSEGRTQHKLYADGQCEVCHEVHGSSTASLLKGGGIREHCRSCHEDTSLMMSVAAHSHAEVEGSCLACHKAHASDHRKLLTGPTREQCTNCHEEIGRTVAGAIVSHDAVLKGDQCISCHEPHGTDNAMMLRADQTPVCLTCHATDVIAADGRKIPEIATLLSSAPFVHGPVASGNCGACHSVHGGDHAKLLKQLNPETLTGAFDIRNYALCFACHDRELAMVDSPSATHFRNGDINLHARHLSGPDRSRSCGTCHAVHTSQRARLMAENAPFEGSEWRMPMGFVIRPDGGSCSPGCHEPLSYRRSGSGKTGPNPQGGTP